MSINDNPENQAEGMSLNRSNQEVASFQGQINAAIAQAVASEKAISEARQEEKERSFQIVWEERAKDQAVEKASLEARYQARQEERDRDKIKTELKLKIEPVKPSQYKGELDTLKIVTWVTELDDYFENVEATEEEKSRYIAPWSDFKQDLIRSFSNPAEERRLIRQYTTLKQTTSVHELIQEHMRLRRILPQDVFMSEKLEIDNFAKALKPRVECEMGRHPKTLGEAYEYATNFEETFIRSNQGLQRSMGYFVPPPSQMTDEAVPMYLSAAKAKSMSNKQCYSCARTGHLSRQCLQLKRTKETLTGIDIDTPENEMITVPVRTIGVTIPIIGYLI
ncbi:hypothetical protein E3P78_04185 [Wallemia ichthyophaga]|nr:hypothetical protein E3P78_04185 [Wallemia ichthyophaga]